jgi:RNase_H superfamily
MASKKVQLYKYVKLDGQWKYCKAVFSANNRIKAHALMTSTGEQVIKDGYYVLSYQRKWESVGNDPIEAQRLLLLRRGELATLAHCGAVVSKVAETTVAGTVKEALDAWVQDHVDAGAAKFTVRIKRMVAREFQESCKEKMLANVTRQMCLRFINEFLKKRGNGDRTRFNKYLHLRQWLKFHQLEHLDAQNLSNLKRRWGRRLQKVGKKAEAILRNAEVLVSGKERILAPVTIPAHDNYVMFDLEGVPPNLGDLEKVYLWGMQVYGKSPSKFVGVTSGFGADGDREGWDAFLDAANDIFAEYGDIPIVHWHHYERVHIDLYVGRYGDSNGVAERVLRNLLDLLPVTKNSVVLPLPSYSLKVVEGHVGFERTQDEYGGSWAMGKFILATETDDETERNGLMAEILKYNEEDLAATWAVFEWLRSK